MSLARTRIEFLHDLLHEKHIENPENGYCLRCASPPRFHPCPVRRRIVDHLIRIEHVAENQRAALERGSITCPCGAAPPYVILDP
jgi:hypothetical protein